MPSEALLSSLPGTVTSQAIILGVTLGLAGYFLLRKKYKLPPGPPSLPLLGNILSFRNTTIYQKTKEWGTQYGPVMTIYLGPLRCIVLNRIDVVLEALVKKQADFAGRPTTYSGNVLSEGGKDIALGNYGPTWKLHRKLATKALRLYLTGDRLEKQVSASLSKAIEGMKKENGPFNPHRYMSLVTFNILSGVCFSEIYDDTDEEFRKIISILDSFLDNVGNGFLEDIIPPLRIYPTQKFRNIINQTDEFLKYVYDKINQHRKTFSSENIRDFTDSILLAQQEAEQEEDPALLAQITDTHVGQTVTDIFTAGIDTSRLTLDWTLLYLATNQDIQAKVHEEVDSVLDKGQLPVLTDRDRLPYTEATLHESMRMGTVAPMGFPHETICDTTLGGYEIPKNTMVMINHWVLHHDPDQWDDVETFRPERFLDETGKMAPKPQSWLPFSAGRRVCLGETVAKPELHLILAALMRTFHVSLPKGVKPDFEPQGGSFGSLPKPYEIIVKER